MIMPDTTKPAIENVRLRLCHKVGQTVVTKLIAEETGETYQAVNRALAKLHKEGRLDVDRKNGQTTIFKVLPNISQPRLNAHTNRSNRVVNKRGPRPAKGAFVIESNVRLPSGMVEAYPFDKMKQGDSFAFKLAEDAVSVVKNAADKYSENFDPCEFVVNETDKRFGRCWRIS